MTCDDATASSHSPLVNHDNRPFMAQSREPKYDDDRRCHMRV